MQSVQRKVPDCADGQGNGGYSLVHMARHAVYCHLVLSSNVRLTKGSVTLCTVTDARHPLISRCQLSNPELSTAFLYAPVGYKPSHLLRVKS